MRREISLPQTVDDCRLSYGNAALEWPGVSVEALVRPPSNISPRTVHWTDLAKSNYSNCFPLTTIGSELWVSTMRTPTAFVTGMCAKLPRKSAASALDTLQAAYQDIEGESGAVRPLVSIGTPEQTPGYEIELHHRQGLPHSSTLVWMTGAAELPPAPGYSDVAEAYSVFATLAFATTVLIDSVISAQRERDRHKVALTLRPLQDIRPPLPGLYRPPSRTTRLFGRALLTEKLFPAQIPGDDLIGR